MKVLCIAHQAITLSLVAERFHAQVAGRGIGIFIGESDSIKERVLCCCLSFSADPLHASTAGKPDTKSHKAQKEVELLCVSCSMQLRLPIISSLVGKQQQQANENPHQSVVSLHPQIPPLPHNLYGLPAARGCRKHLDFPQIL